MTSQMEPGAHSSDLRRPPLRARLATVRSLLDPWNLGVELADGTFDVSPMSQPRGRRSSPTPRNLRSIFIG